MANPDQIEQELREYLDIEKNLRSSDRLPYLMSIINKHFAVDKIDHVIDYSDLDDIVARAKINWVNTTLPIEISRKTVDGQIVNYVLVIESLVEYLNKNKLLRRLIKFDHTRRKL